MKHSLRTKITNSNRFSCIWCISWLTLLASSAAFGQRIQNTQSDPSIAYIYPAGAQRGTNTTITIGGQFLENADFVYVSGAGIRTTVLDSDRPLNTREVNQMRDKLQETREEMGMESGARMGGRDMQKILDETGITREDLKKMRAHSEMRQNPKVQDNAQVGDTVTVELEVLPDARPGRRELRVIRDGRISAPLAIYIGDYPERIESDGTTIEQALPVVLNGQILPGETDRYSFHASKGDQLVVAVAARELIPHLADAVPGWFQATMALFDSEGSELAYADDYRFNPDPLLYYKIPSDGTYTLEIKDSLYRGREDFVYRITLGEIPFITSIYPLGGQIGTKTAVEIRGNNLPASKGNVGNQSMIDSIKGVPLASPIPFAQNSLPDLFEIEPNNMVSNAMVLSSVGIINGKINHPGDRDLFEVQMKKDETLITEVFARRLNSPLDSILMITDASGKIVAKNDDYEDISLGRMTHHADSRIPFKAPESGTYIIHLGDSQNGGSPDHAYRLHVSRPSPDYELRVVPSSLNAPAGASVPFTIYALRKDGFNGEIKLKLGNQTEGFRLDGGRIPAGADQVEVTLTLPSESLYLPVPIRLEGKAVIDGKPVSHQAIPAEDMMQAFIYHHLIPTEELMLSNVETRLERSPSEYQAEIPIKLQPGKSTILSFSTPTTFDRYQVQLDVEARNLPLGVEITDVSIKPGHIEITLSIDASATKGEEGNLLFDLLIDKKRVGTNLREGSQETIRIEAGTLPAVPYKIR